MKRRIVVVALTVVGLTSLGSAAQADLDAAPTVGTGYWGCAVVDRADTAICLKNPLPERLPTPG